MYLQAQLDGLESIFLELIPSGIELKRQQIQDYYEKRYGQAIEPPVSIAENELKRQINTKANHTRNLVDCTESIGDSLSKVNLIRAAACLPSERKREIKPTVLDFCQCLILENSIKPDT